jgi:hypothetical protein
VSEAVAGPLASGAASELGQAAGGGAVVVGDVPQQQPGFQPRAGLLEMLDAAGPVVAVTGVPGVGKTQLAAAYARAKLADGWPLVAWVNAEDATALAGGLAAVAEAVEAVGLAGPDGGDPGRAVRNWLQVRGDRCLLVFDNAADLNLLRPYLPAAGTARVLITSNRATPADLGTPVSVEVFTPGEAKAFLAGQTGLADAANAGEADVREAHAGEADVREAHAGEADAGEAHAGELAEELGFLPLALAQAAAVIRDRRLAYGTYLERLRAVPVYERLARGSGQPYPHRMAEAVLLSLEAVRAGDRTGACGGVMEVLSVLSAAGVRRDLLHAAGQAGVLAGGQAGVLAGGGDRPDAAVVDETVVDEAVVDEAVGRLAEWSLLAFSLDGQVVAAHPLVLRVIREGLARQGRFTAVCRAAAAVLDTHARAVANSPDRLAVRDVPEQVAALQQALQQASQQASQQVFQQAAAGSAGVPPQLEPVLLRLRLWALYHLNELGDSAARAIAVGEPLLEDAEQALGPDHRSTLAVRNNLANAYRAAGRAAEAVPLHEQTLAALERVLGPDHPDTLRSRGSLALAYQDAGRAAKAIPLHQQTLADRERVLGPDHSDTLAARDNLADAYQDTGWAAEAIPLHRQTLAARERVLGSDHPDTLASRSSLAAAYQKASRTAEAIPLFEQTLADRERVLGPDHPDTLASRSNLAAAYQKAGWAAEAVPLFDQTQAAFERVLGPDHPRTLASRNNLAAAHRAADRAAEAIPPQEQTLAEQEKELGADHPLTLAARSNLATAYRAAGRYAEAIPLHEQTLADRERVLGPDHPDTLASRSNLAAAHRAASRSS